MCATYRDTASISAIVASTFERAIIANAMPSYAVPYVSLSLFLRMETSRVRLAIFENVSRGINRGI